MTTTQDGVGSRLLATAWHYYWAMLKSLNSEREIRSPVQQDGSKVRQVLVSTVRDPFFWVMLWFFVVDNAYVTLVGLAAFSFVLLGLRWHYKVIQREIQ